MDLPRQAQVEAVKGNADEKKFVAEGVRSVEQLLQRFRVQNDSVRSLQLKIKDGPEVRARKSGLGSLHDGSMISSSLWSNFYI